MPMPTSWSARTLAVSLALWAILVTAYVSLSFVRHELLPPPYGTLTMVVLMMLTIGAVVGMFADRNRAHSEARAAKLQAWLTGRLVALETRVEVSADVRYARLHSLVVGLDRRLDAMDEPTVVLPRRQRIVATVSAPKATLMSSGLDPEVLDLARRLNAQMAGQAAEED